MLLTLENTKNLSSYDFIETFSIEVWDEVNIHLVRGPKKDTFPDYFYLTACLLEFDTEFQMSGILTLLTNSLNGFKQIESHKLTECLQGILNTLHKFGMTPIKMREQFLNGAQNLPECSIITTGQYFDEKGLLAELKIHGNKLDEIYGEIWPDLESYLIKIRGH
jgi:hypothetical protein